MVALKNYPRSILTKDLKYYCNGNFETVEKELKSLEEMIQLYHFVYVYSKDSEPTLQCYICSLLCIVALLP